MWIAAGVETVAVVGLVAWGLLDVLRMVRERRADRQAPSDKT
jgi:hypothetical protein